MPIFRFPIRGAENVTIEVVADDAEEAHRIAGETMHNESPITALERCLMPHAQDEEIRASVVEALGPLAKSVLVRVTDGQVSLYDESATWDAPVMTALEAIAEACDQLHPATIAGEIWSFLTDK